jgi:putative Holliday junction resolvase
MMSAEEGRILGVDWGEKRIGLAISDPLRITAQSLETVTCSSPRQSIEEVVRVTSPFEIERAVIGLPLRLNGSPGTQAGRVRQWGGKLSRALSIPVTYRDERLTSREAERVLLRANVRRKRRRELTDQLAAQIILQSYLNQLEFEV